MAFTKDAVQVGEPEATVHEIVTSIADQTGTGVLDLPPLNDSVDTDALTTLVRNETTSTVEFEYTGHTVTVDADGRVTVSDEVRR